MTLTQQLHRPALHVTHPVRKRQPSLLQVPGPSLPGSEHPAGHACSTVLLQPRTTFPAAGPAPCGTLQEVAERTTGPERTPQGFCNTGAARSAAAQEKKGTTFVHVRKHDVKMSPNTGVDS